MVARNKIEQIIFEAIEDLNLKRPQEDQLKKSEDTVLFGYSGQLDSLGLVDLVLAVEQKITEKLDRVVTLADEKAMSQEKSPFRTVGFLAEYICQLLEEGKDG